MASSQDSTLQERLRPIILALVVAGTFIQVLVLTPVSVEHRSTPLKGMTEKSELLPRGEEKPILAPGIPDGVIPSYVVKSMVYISTQHSVKEWKLHAETAQIFQVEQILHGIDVIAYFYDENGRATKVVGREAKYRTDKKELEVYGDVVSTFPDGYEIKSQYLHYQPNLRLLDIPHSELVQGEGNTEDDQSLKFTSHGLIYRLDRNEISLPQDVIVTIEELHPKAGVLPQRTILKSDEALIERNKKIITFSMRKDRPLEERFVETFQTNLYVKSRTAQLDYEGDPDKKASPQSPGRAGERKKGSAIQKIYAFDDVYFREVSDDHNVIRYGTCGQAEFEASTNRILLRRYPQMYQNSDTITGDVIVIHRDTDLVEVENSNATNQGNSFNRN